MIKLLIIPVFIFCLFFTVFAIEINFGDLNKIALGVKEKLSPFPSIIPESIRLLANNSDIADYRKMKYESNINIKIYYPKKNGIIVLPTNVFCILLTDSSIGETCLYGFSQWEKREDKLILDTLFDPIVTGYGNVEIIDTLRYKNNCYFVLLSITGGDAGDMDEAYQIRSVDENKKGKLIYFESCTYTTDAETIKRLKILFLHGHDANHEIMRIVTVNKSTESGVVSAADTSFLFPDSLLKKPIRSNPF